MPGRRRGLDALILVAALTVTSTPVALDALAIGNPGATKPLTAVAGPSASSPQTSPAAQADGPSASAEPARPSASSPTSTPPPAPTPVPTPSGPRSDQTTLRFVRTIWGNIAPKSVVASDEGLVVAENMMYRHSVTVYDTSGQLIRTISDRVNLADLGWPEYPDSVRGAPVEAAFSPDGGTVYVSNYSMYGPGFPKPGWDLGTPADMIDESFVYRIDLASGTITGAAKVGSVPKFLAASPDGRWLIVANWTSRDLSVVDLSTFREITRIPVGPEPRGIAFSPDSAVAYVTVQFHQAAAGYPDELYRLDTATWTLTPMRVDLGLYPRHLVIDPAGQFLYSSLTGEGKVIKIEAATGLTVGTTVVGAAPRTIAIAPDGRSLYVVNYDDRTLVKVDTTSMRVVQRLPTATHPIGVTYEPLTNTVWVACYSGALQLFHEGN